MIGNIMIMLATILVARELYKTCKGYYNEDYIYWDERHSRIHISYYTLYLFTLWINIIHLFWYLNQGYVNFFWTFSTILLIIHTRWERHWY